MVQVRWSSSNVWLLLEGKWLGSSSFDFSRNYNDILSSGVQFLSIFAILRSSRLEESIVKVLVDSLVESEISVTSLQQFLRNNFPFCSFTWSQLVFNSSSFYEWYYQLKIFEESVDLEWSCWKLPVTSLFESVLLTISFYQEQFVSEFPSDFFQLECWVVCCFLRQKILRYFN